ncbi:GH92 family glycosyl hydrolase [Christiangramia crocea]|uniref:GH92 family glycosyl hydrolase n=1 Tax=Christiangramia crocea TaxID=2904124 RepID=A0A9X2A797_9FLAO|nr:GH92 family glycosyl hydrolase [Gramella crocea]MCG9970593.1 GH92 family glycosyl hydrolase [Gramella crocea]
MLKSKLYLFVLILIIPGMYAQSPGNGYTDLVNPFIGTEGAGNTFPGAALPFGMVKLGPDSGDLLSNSGYVPDEDIKGFSHTHVSGTGGGAKYGNILVMPYTGPFELNGIRSAAANEKASPGYFSADLLDYDIKAQFTVSHRVGFHKYEFSGDATPGLLINAGSLLGEGHCCDENQELIGSEIQVISDSEIKGYSRVRGGWNKGGAYTVYFYAITDKPAISSATWKGEEISTTQKSRYNSGEKTGAFLEFDRNMKELNLKVGISFISSEKAKANLEKEVPHWDFEKLRQESSGKWEDMLNNIQVSTKNNDLKTIFYTALYHTMLMPTNRTGENPYWKSELPYYDDYYAIWDTYRATNPLLTLILPDRETQIVNSLLNIYQHEGYMPDSRSGNSTGRTQGGSNTDMVIADAILKGLEDIDYELAYEAMIQNAEIPPGGKQETNGRGGINKYIELGYVPAEYEPEKTDPSLHTPKLYDRAGTRTVEYAANDWAIAQVAKELGEEEAYKKYKKRASNWANLWRPVETEGVKGFIWPKRRDGSWVEDFSVEKYGSWGNFFYEANSWEYSFYVPQDVNSLIDSTGGKKEFIKRLDIFFENEHFKVDNEPSFFTPTLYTYAGYQYRTNERIRKIIEENYTAQRDGIPGNDDAGSMSAWLVFNSLGFYPNAGQDVYIITSPHFKEAILDIGNDKELILKAENLSDENIYIEKVLLNGSPLNRAWFRHSEIDEGGEMEFIMTSRPTDFGTKNLPPSLSDKGLK